MHPFKYFYFVPALESDVLLLQFAKNVFQAEGVVDIRII